MAQKTVSGQGGLRDNDQQVSGADTQKGWNMASDTGKQPIKCKCVNLKAINIQVFTHGQLYVACSRVGSPEKLKFALMKSDENECEKAKNVVYNEVLL